MVRMDTRPRLEMARRLAAATRAPPHQRPGDARLIAAGSQQVLATLRASQPKAAAVAQAAPAPITEAEIKPLAGTWFNAQEPSMFDLAWQNGEATVTQNGLPFVLGRRADGWLAAERGSFEFALKPGAKATVRVDLGAGRVMTFAKLGRRKAAPTALAARQPLGQARHLGVVAHEHHGGQALVQAVDERQQRGGARGLVVEVLFPHGPGAGVAGGPLHTAVCVHFAGLEAGLYPAHGVAGQPLTPRKILPPPAKRRLAAPL